MLGITGSVAAYKAVEVARLLLKEGARVEAVMTRSAERFLGPVTLSGITGRPVLRDMWDPSTPGELHVALADRADCVLVAPCTADTLARFASGRADDLLAALVLSSRGPVLVAPAMHPRMWAHPATQRNARTLAEDGRLTLVGPAFGEVASGDVGLGRMVEPAELVAAVCAALGPRDFAGLRVLVTAGPTHEPLDPVRFLGNRSSGKMGFALARAAKARGAEVVLIAGPVAEPTPAGVRRVDITTALELSAALDAEVGEQVDQVDLVIMAAAVADFRPATTSDRKIKKAPGAPPPALALAQNPDLLAGLGARRGSRGRCGSQGARPAVLVGFALETGDDAEIVAYGETKLAAKRVDLVVANRADESLGQGTNRVALIGHDGATWLPHATKETLADSILDRALALSQAR